jgi:hypothetical protein
MAKFLNPYPPLDLGLQDEQELEKLGAMLVDECVALYGQHLDETKGHGMLDPARWKHVKTRDDVHVYQERPGFSPARSNNDSDLPTLLAIGTIVGDLDDVMYGVVNHSIDMMRMKTSYVEDNLVNAAVLANLIEPSVSDPFRSLAVKWAVKGRSAIVRSLVKNRDFVYLESTGITALESGDRIGYQLLHSVQFPQVGDAPGGETVRGNMSMCCVYRQVAPNVVQLFMRGFLDPAGGVMRAVVIKSAGEVMVSVWKNVYCAQLKKLAWAIRRRRQRRHTNRMNHHAFDGRPVLGVAAANRDTCTVCNRKSMLGTSRSATCRLCFDPICRSCRIRKSLSFFGPDRELIQQRIAFCTRCFTRVATTSAYSVASDEILAKDSYRGYVSGGTNSGTYMSSPTSSSASFSNYSVDSHHY